MCVNQTTNLRIGCEYSQEYERVYCKYIHLKVNPDATDEDLLFTAQTLADLQTLPLYSIDRYDNCDLTE